MKTRLPALVLAAAIAGGCASHVRPRAADAISGPSVRSHLEFLAGDALNGRGSGTRDEWIAASYIGEQMRRWGIEPLGDHGTYVQAITIERSDIAAPPVLSAGSIRLTHGSEMLVQSISAAQTSGPLLKLPPGGAVPAGAAVLIPEGTTAQTVREIGSAAIVMIRETPQFRERWPAMARTLPRLAPRISGLPETSARPAVIVLDAASHAAVAALADGTPVKLEAEAKAPVQSHTWNASGRLPGRDPERAREVILLTAHLDHLGARTSPGGPGGDTIFNGADDDASGCVAVLQLAEALSKGKRPKRTIVFTWFGSEESGGFGARYFIERPPVPLTQIVANLEFEMIGRPDPTVASHTLWLTGFERSNLGPALARHGARLVQDPHPEQNFFQRSDNIQLARRGVVAQTVSSYGLHKEYHTPADEVRLVDLPHMTESIQSMLAPVRWLANSDFAPHWLPGKKP